MSLDPLFVESRVPLWIILDSNSPVAVLIHLRKQSWIKASAITLVLVCSLSNTDCTVSNIYKLTLRYQARLVISLLGVCSLWAMLNLDVSKSNAASNNQSFILTRTATDRWSLVHRELLSLISNLILINSVSYFVKKSKFMQLDNYGFHTELFADFIYKMAVAQNLCSI